jgi:putative MFS transporter
MEVSEEPADAYVGAYAIVCGIAAILAGVFGGLVGKFINNGVIYIFGEEFYTIRFAFAIGFVLRLFSLLELTRVDSFEKTFIYKGSLPIKNFFSKRILNVGASYINDMKKSERESKNIKTENKENDKNIDNNEVKGVKKETENQENKIDKIENSEKRTDENNIDKTV